MAESRVVEITIGIAVLVICLIYLYERLMNRFMYDVLFAIFVLSGALIYIYSNLNLMQENSGNSKE